MYVQENYTVPAKSNLLCAHNHNYLATDNSWQGRTQDLELGGMQRAEGRKEGGCGRGPRPLPLQLGGMGEHCKLPPLGAKPQMLRKFRGMKLQNNKDQPQHANASQSCNRYLRTCCSSFLIFTYLNSHKIHAGNEHINVM